ncbi:MULTISPECIES: ABC transporter substrate-binding protein [unclassified Streptococcus]|uniref:ABC transporter substrate-binding protein n=1 Tax=unclassified Streptococcus TaxID=2608887 RepID=UPI0011B576E1|nr:MULTISPECIES: ABC transporter substrate binding protein [unclassified Streptococcus]TWS95258.1 hypothetical protein FRX52_00195 [Streptococcus sp. sy018]TWT16369.1 hypothetical protein FRX51_00200 [Streptococcus sp. sy010]
MSLAGLALLGLGACSATGKQSNSTDSVKIGILQYMEHDSLTVARKGFVDELAANGYKEGEKITLNYQNAQGDQAPIDKQIELLGQALPTTKTVGILYTTSERNVEVQVKQAKKLLEKASYQVMLKGITSSNDVQDITSSLMKDVGAIFVSTDNTIASTRTMIGDLSVANKVLVIGGSTDMVNQGGLLTYSTNYEALGRQIVKIAIKTLLSS